MRRFLRSLLFLIAQVSDQEAALMIQFLKVENGILRSKLPKRIPITPKEQRRLIKFGKPLGKLIKDLITIVTPRTFARWINSETKPAKPPKPGRPRVKEDVRELILRLARENGWGYTRILGELRKLKVRKVSRTTVLNILREGGFDPGPKRGEGTWDEFISRHVSTLWACDFFSKKIWTTTGLIDAYVLFFLHVGSRKIVHCAVTDHPHAAWMAQQARNLSILSAEPQAAARYLIRDRDSKFTAQFDDILNGNGVEIAVTQPLAPNMNAHAERFVQTIKQECLDHFVVFGLSHLRHIISEFLEHYDAERPHQSKDNLPLSGLPPGEETPISPADVQCSRRLGGLLKHYYRKAA